jgi:hypothetical protein
MTSIHLLSLAPSIRIPNPLLSRSVLFALLGLALFIIISTGVFFSYTYLRSSVISSKNGILMLRVEEPNYNLMDPVKEYSFVRHLRSRSET